MCSDSGEDSHRQVIDDVPASVREQELEELFLRFGHRFTRVELRRRTRDCVRGLLGPVGRKNSWQLAEFAGHSTPDGLQHPLAKSRWEADEIRDDLQGYVAEHLGADDGILIIDGTGFVKKGITSAGVQRQYTGTAGRTENCQIGVFAAYPPAAATLSSTASSTPQVLDRRPRTLPRRPHPPTPPMRDQE
ncbi:IS701 family transposase [Streptomyces axinellae]|uniref:Transposase IS701-like DDE domain-containing protein n=1 Tax=Streptomyces axinellae TaxID=552788 RepID=A0ABN3PND4_9ACTN